MLIVAIFAGVLLAYLLQFQLYKKKAFEGLRYDVTLSADEVFEGEDVFLYEEIVNTRLLPVPFVKVDTSLPRGLRYCLIEKDEAGNRHGKFSESVQSIFVLRPYQKIKRTWRVNCKTRGEYSVGEVLVVTNDLIGFNQRSERITVRATSKNHLVVLPKTVGLEGNFTASRYLNGDVLTQQSIVSDPLRICGVREYVTGDPMNRINWKSTAAHNMLMVNVEEFTRRHQFNLVLNMNSRDIERVPGPPAIPAFVESAVTVTASILDAVSNENISVHLITNTLPPEADETMTAAVDEEDEIGKEIFISPALSGKNDMLAALRMIAMLPMHITVSIEKMLDHIAAHPERYAGGGNLIVVSAYVSERMINFSYVMKRSGVDVIFYVTTSNNNAEIIPEDVTVYFKTNLEEEAV